MKKPSSTAAILTIKKPGTMTKQGRKDIADWLRRAASDLVKLGDQYTKTKFTARYYYLLPVFFLALASAHAELVPATALGTSCTGTKWGVSDQPSLANASGIYKDFRYGNQTSFSCDFVRPVGVCDVVFDLSEPSKTGPGQRVFTITANGNLSAKIDLYAITGAVMLPTQFTMQGIWVLDGHLRFTFNYIGIGNPLVNGFEFNCHPPTVPAGPNGNDGLQGPPGADGAPGKNGVMQIVPIGGPGMLAGMLNCVAATTGQAGIKCTFDPANPLKVNVQLDPAK